MLWSVGSVSGYRLAVRRAGASDGVEPLGMVMAMGTKQLANLSSVSSTWSLSAICHDLSLPDIRLDSKTWMFSDGKRWKPQKYSETEVVITPYQDQRRCRDNESCHQNLRLQMILYSALIHLILTVNRMNNGPSSVFRACSLVY